MKKTIISLLMFCVVIQMFAFLAYADEYDTLKTPSGISFSDLKSVIDKYAEDYIGKTTAGGSVIVLQNDKTILHESYGYSDIENKINVTDDTLFEWGSTTKLLVWVSVMQLVEQNKLDLNEDIKVYLPKDFLTKLKYNDAITMINLMNHNAGWEAHLTDLFYRNPKNVKSLKDSLEIFEPTQVHKPGDVVAYSNYGTALAAYIVECITDMSFFEYVNKNIFDILDMNKTSIHPLQKDNSYVEENRQLTKGYMLNTKGFIERPTFYIGIYPAGSAIGTISDMSKFVSALMPRENEASPLFANKATLKTIFSKSYEPTNDFPGICHGFWEHYYSVRTLEHGGNTDSFSAQITFAPEEGVAVLIMTNQSQERSLCFGIKDKIFGSYKADEYGGELPDSSFVIGSYLSMRKIHTGFSKWLSFIVNEVTRVDEKTIAVNKNVYRQIKPYVYQHMGEGGASELIYFDVKDNQVTKMYQEYGESEPISSFNVFIRLALIFSLIACLVFFVIAFIYSVIRVFNKKEKFSARDKITVLLNSVGFISTVNTLVMFLRTTMYPSYNELRIHFIVNILSLIIIVLMICSNLVLEIKRKPIDKAKTGYILSHVFIIYYGFIIFICQLYR